ncbi:MAG: DNA-formamidopyrimidine glycosylase [Chloroflexi bacterium]|nr:DNA-formamidopyrimidine glycosylase [Chloroflexota bacterium]
MPELPEVESLVRDLTPTVVGRCIDSVELHKEKLFLGLAGLTLDDLRGRTIRALWRRGKLTVWELSDGVALVVHLKLAGQLVHISADGSELAHGGHPVPMWGTHLPHKSSHVIFHLDDGSTLYLTDIRQFARVYLMPDADVPLFLKKQRLGPEPLTRKFVGRDFATKLKRRNVELKRVLLDQSVVGGIGNIYADESLWRARLHPRRLASSLSDAEITRLHRAIRAVLDYAVREGAAFVPHGKAISDRDFPYCHGRAGSPCPRCGTIIVKDWVGGRGTHWCPKCEREHPGERWRKSMAHA